MAIDAGAARGQMTAMTHKLTTTMDGARYAGSN
jgi:hypothetical protein